MSKSVTLVSKTPQNRASMPKQCILCGGPVQYSWEEDFKYDAFISERTRDLASKFHLPKSYATIDIQGWTIDIRKKDLVAGSPDHIYTPISGAYAIPYCKKHFKFMNNISVAKEKAQMNGAIILGVTLLVLVFVVLTVLSPTDWTDNLLGAGLLGIGGAFGGYFLAGYWFTKIGKKRYSKELDELGISNLKLGRDAHCLGWGCTADLIGGPQGFLSNPQMKTVHTFANQEYAKLFSNANTKN